jgi:branched-chain amino acid transport system substrate-binding protein
MKFSRFLSVTALGLFYVSCSSKPVDFYSTRRPQPARPAPQTAKALPQTTKPTASNTPYTTETVTENSPTTYSAGSPNAAPQVPTPAPVPEANDYVGLLRHPSISPKVAEDLIVNRMNSSQLETVVRDQSLITYRPMAMYQLGMLNLKTKRSSQALENFRGLVAQYPQHPLTARANEMVTLLQATQEVDSHILGAILPLTGRNSSVGQHVLNALRLGLGVDKPDAKFKLVTFDTQSNPDLAAAGVDKLLLENKVIGLVGGLSSKEATLIAQRAELFSTPFIALTQKPGLTSLGDYVFQNSLTPEMQVDQLAIFAFNKLNAKRFAILYPNDSYGVEFANIFWDQVLAHGGQVTAAQTYDSKENDFTGIIQKMVGTYYPEARAEEFKQRLDEIKKAKRLRAQKNKKDNKKPVVKNSREHEVEESILQPMVDFDVLFLPDSGKTLSQVMAFMKVNEVPSITYLGTNIWNSPEIVKRAAGQKESIYFVDAIDPNDNSVRETDFFKEYYAAFNEEPTLIEMQAYESAKILRDTINTGGTSRDSLASRLRIMGRSTGVTGELRMSNNREIERPVHVLSLDNGLIHKIN